MAQGKEWTKEEREKIIQSICKYLELGFSRNKACNFVGIAPSTLSNWTSQDEALGMILTGAENMVNTVAMQNVVDAIRKEGEREDDTRKDNSWKWLEKRMKEEFSDRKEITGAEGKPLIPEREEQINQALEDL